MIGSLVCGAPLLKTDIRRRVWERAHVGVARMYLPSVGQSDKNMTVEGFFWCNHVLIVDAGVIAVNFVNISLFYNSDKLMGNRTVTL